MVTPQQHQHRLTVVISADSVNVSLLLYISTGNLTMLQSVGYQVEPYKAILYKSKLFDCSFIVQVKEIWLGKNATRQPGSCNRILRSLSHAFKTIIRAKQCTYIIALMSIITLCAIFLLAMPEHANGRHAGDQLLPSSKQP